MKLLRELFEILTPRQRRYVLLAQLISIVMAFSTVAGIAAIAPFFAVLGDPALVDRQQVLHWLYVNGGFTSRRDFVVALGLGFIAVVVIVNVINIMGASLMRRLALSIGNALQTALFVEYLHRPYGFHTRTSSTTLFNNVIYETQKVSSGILQTLFQLFTSSVTAVFIIVSVLLLNPLACIAMLVGLGGGYLLIYASVRNRLLRWGQAQSRLATEQVRIVNESFGAIKEINVLQVHGFFRNAFERASNAITHVVARIQGISQTPRNLMECIAVAGLVGLALVLATHEKSVSSWLAQLTFLSFALYRLLPTLQQVFVGIVRIRADRAGFALIAADLRAALATRRSGAQASDTRAKARAQKQAGAGADALVGEGADARAGAAGTWRDTPARDIALVGVSFRYAPDRPWALEDVTVRIPARSTVALVGANGSGKTTLADLIAGLLVPGTGRILVDGVELSDTNRAAWQSRIAYVPQSPFLFDTTIAQNIALGIQPSDIDRERLHAAIRLAQLEDLISTLPGGAEHMIGEKGVRLSGGQRQRVGIARALYRESPVLILDEATNALDGLTEQELILTLQQLHGRYTMLVIAHRPSSVRTCDTIIELGGGRVLSSGTPQEMLQRSATYRRMAGMR